MEEGTAMKKLGMSYAAACAHPDLFGPWFSGSSWDRWRVLDRAMFAEPLDDVELEIFKHLSGRQEAITERPREIWLGLGRRSAKDLKAASIAAYLSTIGAEQMTAGAARGERTYVMILAVDRSQAKICLGYTSEFFRIPALAPFVRRENADGLELTNGITIEIFTNDQRRARGRRVGLCIFDEVAHWRSDVSSNPAEDVYESIMPSMANVPGAMLIGISSVHMRSGLFYKKVSENFGKPGPILSVRAPTWIMNPTLPFDGPFIEARYRENPAFAKAEFGSEWRSDLESYCSIEALEACTDKNVFERKMNRQNRHFAAYDGSGGVGDSAALCVGHKEGDSVVIDLIREVPAPHDPEMVLAEFSDILRAWRIKRVISDRYGAEWARSAWRKNGIHAVESEFGASEAYNSFLPMLNSQSVRLLDNKKMAAQFLTLERSPRRGARDSVDHPRGTHDDIANAVALLATYIDGKNYANREYQEFRPTMIERGGRVFPANGPWQ
jgi:hypothetical protein